MSEIKFSPQEKDILTKKLQHYCRDELDQEIGQFDAQFLLTFITKEIGPYFYNSGLYDAQAILQNRVESITEAIYDLEKPTDFDR